MLTSIRVKGFKSLRDTGDVPLAPLTCILGPNGSGKTALLEAVRVHAALAFSTPVSHALKDAAGDPLHAFTLPPDGMKGLFLDSLHRICLEADYSLRSRPLHSRFDIVVNMLTASFSVERAELRVWHDGASKPPRVFNSTNSSYLKWVREGTDDSPDAGSAAPLRLRATDAGGAVPDKSYDLAGEYLEFQCATFYHDLNSSSILHRPMRPELVEGIGRAGADLVPYLHWMQQREPESIRHLSRAVAAVVPNFGGIEVETDFERRLVDVHVTFEGERIRIELASYGLIRIIMLATIMLAQKVPACALIEEPEHGIHPHLQGRMVKLLASRLGRSPLQVIFTTHSPFVAWHVMKLAAEKPDLAAVLVARRGPEGSTFRKLTTDDFAYYAKQRGEDDPLADPAGFIDAYERGVLDA
jgi:predicted ATPase